MSRYIPKQDEFRFHPESWAKIRDSARCDADEALTGVLSDARYMAREELCEQLSKMIVRRLSPRRYDDDFAPTTERERIAEIVLGLIHKAEIEGERMKR